MQLVPIATFVIILFLSCHYKILAIIPGSGLLIPCMKEGV